MNVRTMHRWGATLVGGFASVHIANHLLGLLGAGVHLQVMDALRHIYRWPPLETLMLLAIAGQALGGLWLFAAGFRARRGLLSWTQAVSGLLLGLFLTVHVLAILYGRSLQLDTNLYYAAAGVQLPQTRGFFIPYYAIGVIALFVHVGCGLRRLQLRRAAGPESDRAPRDRKWLAGSLAAGALVATLLVLLLAGAVTSVEVPQKYFQTFNAK